MNGSIIRAVLVAIFPLLSSICLAVDPTAEELKNPQWWLARGRESAAKITDPEDRAMMKQLLSAGQGAFAPREELTKWIESQREKLRTQFGKDAEWQFELFASQHYQTAERYREALDAWKRARRLAESRIEEEKRNEKPGVPYDPSTEQIHYRFRTDLDSIGSNAAHRGELELAFEAVECAENQHSRDLLLPRIAYRQAKADPQAAEATLRRLSPKAFQREWWLYLLQQCEGGGREQYERAILQFMKDRAAQALSDAIFSYSKLAFLLVKLPGNTDPQLVRQLETLIESDIGTSTDQNLRDQATICRAALLIGQERWADAQSLAHRSGDPRVAVSITAAMVKRLVELKKLDQAAQLAPQSQDSLMQIARGYLDAKRPDEALVNIERFPQLGDGYSYFALDASKQFAERGEWNKIDRTIAAIDTGSAKIYCLCELSSFVRNLGNPQKGAEFLGRATAILRQIRDEFLAAATLANCYIEIGDLDAARNIVLQYGDDHSRMLVLATIAEKQIALKDSAAFQATMRRIDALSVPAIPDTRPAENKQLQVNHALQRAWLYLLADDERSATNALAKASAVSKELPGSFWRIELYGELLLSRPTRDNLAKVARLSELLPNATDRAVIEWVGASLTTQQQDNK